MECPNCQSDKIEIKPRNVGAGDEFTLPPKPPAKPLKCKKCGHEFSYEEWILIKTLTFIKS